MATSTMLHHAVETTIMDVTPDLARRWLDENHYPGQRPLRQGHVLTLANLMVTGKFRPYSTISFGVLKKRSFLVNGQHTLSAIVQCGIPQELRIEDYPVSSKDDLAMLYSTFDRNLSRTYGDIYHAHNFGPAHALPMHYVNSLSAAIPLMVSGFDSAIRQNLNPLKAILRSPETRLSFMEPWVPMIQRYHQALLGSDNRRIVASMRHGGCAAVALITLRYQSDLAFQFWHAIAMDDGLRARTPAHTLRRWIGETATSVYREGHQYSRYIAAAWNAFYEKKDPYVKIYQSTPSLPIHIAGTPHTSKQRMVYVTKEGTPSWDALPA